MVCPRRRFAAVPLCLSPAGNSSFYWEDRTRVEPAPGRAGQGWAAGWAGGLQAAVPPELQDGLLERPAALTMPPRRFPRGRGARRGGVGDLEGPLRPASPTPSPLAPPLPRPPGAERNSEGPLLGPRVTPVPWGPQRGGRVVLSARKDLILAWRPRPPAHTVRGGEAEAGHGPPQLLCQCVRPAGFRLFAKAGCAAGA